MSGLRLVVRVGHALKRMDTEDPSHRYPDDRYPDDDGQLGSSHSVIFLEDHHVVRRIHFRLGVPIFGT